MRHVIWLLLAGCAVTPAPIAPTNAANPSAPVGRLAGAPATLRADVVHYELPPMRTAPEPHHHH